MTRIIIADENSDSVDLLRTLITAREAEVACVSVESGAALLAALEPLPDLIIMEARLPDADGVAVCRQLRRRAAGQDMPIILVSSAAELADKVAAFNAGAVDYIIKPFQGEELQARVCSQLALKRYRDELKVMNIRLQQAQNALIAQARMSAVGSLAAGIAHEFNNLLGMMGGYLQLGLESPDATSVPETLCMLQTLVGRGESIVQGLLCLARAGKVKGMVKVELPDLVRQTVTLMKKKLLDNAITLELELAELPLVPCFPGEISQVIINLVKNAVEALEGAAVKKITIRAARRVDAPDWVCLSVSDSGPGIPDHLRERIFDPFVTSKGVVGGGNNNTPGTGLGLSIVYGIIQSHGGTISLPDTPSGACFLITLPLQAKETPVVVDA